MSASLISIKLEQFRHPTNFKGCWMGGLERVKELYLLDTIYWGHKYHLNCWPGLHARRTRTRGHLRRCRPWGSRWVVVGVPYNQRTFLHQSLSWVFAVVRWRSMRKRATILTERWVEVYILMMRVIVNVVEERVTDSLWVLCFGYLDLLSTCVGELVVKVIR